MSSLARILTILAALLILQSETVLGQGFSIVSNYATSGDSSVVPIYVMDIGNDLLNCEVGTTLSIDVNDNDYFLVEDCEDPTHTSIMLTCTLCDKDSISDCVNYYPLPIYPIRSNDVDNIQIAGRSFNVYPSIDYEDIQNELIGIKLTEKALKDEDECTSDDDCSCDYNECSTDYSCRYYDELISFASSPFHAERFKLDNIFSSCEPSLVDLKCIESESEDNYCEYDFSDLNCDFLSFRIRYGVPDKYIHSEWFHFKIEELDIELISVDGVDVEEGADLAYMYVNTGSHNLIFKVESTVSVGAPPKGEYRFDVILKPQNPTTDEEISKDIIFENLELSEGNKLEINNGKLNEIVSGMYTIEIHQKISHPILQPILHQDTIDLQLRAYNEDDLSDLKFELEIKDDKEEFISDSDVICNEDKCSVDELHVCEGTYRIVLKGSDGMNEPIPLEKFIENGSITSSEFDSVPKFDIKKEVTQEFTVNLVGSAFKNYDGEKSITVTVNSIGTIFMGYEFHDTSPGILTTDGCHETSKLGEDITKYLKFKNSCEEVPFDFDKDKVHIIGVDHENIDIDDCGGSMEVKDSEVNICDTLNNGIRVIFKDLEAGSYDVTFGYDGCPADTSSSSEDPPECNTDLYLTCDIDIISFYVKPGFEGSFEKDVDDFYFEVEFSNGEPIELTDNVELYITRFKNSDCKDNVGDCTKLTPDDEVPSKFETNPNDLPKGKYYIKIYYGTEEDSYPIECPKNDPSYICSDGDPDDPPEFTIIGEINEAYISIRSAEIGQKDFSTKATLYEKSPDGSLSAIDPRTIHSVKIEVLKFNEVIDTIDMYTIDDSSSNTFEDCDILSVERCMYCHVTNSECQPCDDNECTECTNISEACYSDYYLTSDPFDIGLVNFHVSDQNFRLRIKVFECESSNPDCQVLQKTEPFYIVYGEIDSINIVGRNNEPPNIGETERITFQIKNSHGVVIPNSACTSDTNQVIMLDSSFTSGDCYDGGLISNTNLNYNCKQMMYEFKYDTEKEGKCQVNLDFFELYDNDGDPINMLEISINEGGIHEIEIALHDHNRYDIGDELKIVVNAYGKRRKKVTIKDDDGFSLNIDPEVNDPQVNDPQVNVIDGQLVFTIDTSEHFSEGTYNFKVTYGDPEVDNDEIDIEFVNGSIGDVYANLSFVDCEDVNDSCILGGRAILSDAFIKNKNDAKVDVDNIEYILYCDGKEIKNTGEEEDEYEYILDTIASECIFKALITEDGIPIYNKEVKVCMDEECNSKVYDTYPFIVYRGNVKEFDIKIVRCEDEEEDNECPIVYGDNINFEVSGFKNGNGIEINVDQNDQFELYVGEHITIDEQIKDNVITFTLETDELVEDYNMGIGADIDVRYVYHTDIYAQASFTIVYGDPHELVIVTEKEDRSFILGDEDSVIEFKLFNKNGKLIEDDISNLTTNNYDSIVVVYDDVFELRQFGSLLIDDYNIEIMFNNQIIGTIDFEIIRGQIYEIVMDKEVKSEYVLGSSDIEIEIVSASNENVNDEQFLSLVDVNNLEFIVELDGDTIDEDFYTIKPLDEHTISFNAKKSGTYIIHKAIESGSSGESISINNNNGSPLEMTFVDGNLEELFVVLRNDDGDDIDDNTIIASDEDIYSLYVIGLNENGHYIDTENIIIISDNDSLELNEVSTDGHTFNGIVEDYTLFSIEGLTESGEYNLVFTHEKSQDDIIETYFKLTVLPSIVDPSKSTVGGNGFLYARRSSLSSVRMTLRDVYSNIIPYNPLTMSITSKINGGSNIRLIIQNDYESTIIMYNAPSVGDEFNIQFFIYTYDLKETMLVAENEVELILPTTTTTIPNTIEESDTFDVNGDFYFTETVQVHGSLIFGTDAVVNITESFVNSQSFSNNDVHSNNVAGPLFNVEDGGSIHLNGVLKINIETKSSFDFVNSTSPAPAAFSIYQNENGDDDEDDDDDDDKPKKWTGLTLLVVDGPSTGSFDYQVHNSFNSCTIITPHGYKDNGNTYLTFNLQENESCIEEKTLRGYAIAGVVLGCLLIIAIIVIVVLVIVIKKPFSKKEEDQQSNERANSYPMTTTAASPPQSKENAYYDDHNEESDHDDDDYESESEETDESEYYTTDDSYSQ